MIRIIYISLLLHFATNLKTIKKTYACVAIFYNKWLLNNKSNLKILICREDSAYYFYSYVIT